MFEKFSPLIIILNYFLTIFYVVDLSTNYCDNRMNSVLPFILFTGLTQDSNYSMVTVVH